MVFSNAFTRRGNRISIQISKLWWGASPPVVFVPGTLVRTWGTRPVSWNFVGVSSYVDREPVLVVTKKSENRTSGAKSLSDRTLYGTAGAVP